MMKLQYTPFTVYKSWFDSYYSAVKVDIQTYSEVIGEKGMRTIMTSFKRQTNAMILHFKNGKLQKQQNYFKTV